MRAKDAISSKQFIFVIVKWNPPIVALNDIYVEI